VTQLTRSLGLTASLVSHFFSREYCGKWDLLLAKISVQALRVSWVSQEGKNAIYCQACKSHNLWSRICGTHIKQSHNSQREISVRLKILARFSQDSRVKIINDSRESHCEISVCETRFLRFSLQNFCLWNSREASLATNFDSRVSQKSCENFGPINRVSLLARISKSDSPVNPSGVSFLVNWVNAKRDSTSNESMLSETPRQLSQRGMIKSS
jgi:hypothetical protein